jgi:predicted dehydrogenase
MAGKVRTAVVGAGKMGGIHSKVYSQLEESDFVGVVDVDKNKADALAKQHGCESFASCDDLIGKVDAVTISAPTIYHHDIAVKFIENNIAVMIEKPLAATVEEGKAIVALAEKHGVVAAVGHSERCNPVVQAMQRLDITPKFIEANRISPYSFRSTDIGVVLDVMIHDIDIILSLAASKVAKVDAAGVNVIGDEEDICNARITFENGCIANVTASRLALKTERKVRVFSREAYLSLNFFKKDGIVIQTAPNVNVLEWVREHQQEEGFDFSGVNWPDLLQIEHLDIGDKEPLRVEQESFLEAIIDKSKRPEVTVEEGLAALECADMILTSIKENAWK